MGQNAYIGNKVVVGDNCKIQNNVSVYDNVTLEEAVFCGPSIVFTNVHNTRSLIERKGEFRDTLIKRGKRGATLGANCTIICGITIGEFALKDAGIPTAIHYPIPLNKQPAVADETVTLAVGDEVAAQVISLPMHPYLSESQQIEVSQALGDDLIFNR